jgi:hypothetical protein
MLHSVLVADIAKASQVHTASIFRVYGEDGCSMDLTKVGYIAHNKTV